MSRRKNRMWPAGLERCHALSVRARDEIEEGQLWHADRWRGFVAVGPTWSAGVGRSDDGVAIFHMQNFSVMPCRCAVVCDSNRITAHRSFNRFASSKTEKALPRVCTQGWICRMENIMAGPNVCLSFRFQWYVRAHSHCRPSRAGPIRLGKQTDVMKWKHSHCTPNRAGPSVFTGRFLFLLATQRPILLRSRS